MIEDLLREGVIVGILATGVRLATPFLLAALGEMFGQRSGVLNLGVEGMMLMGAFMAFWATFVLGSPWYGVLAGILVGGLMGLGMAFISVTMQAEQGISGIGVHLFGWGLSSFLFRLTVGAISSIEGFRPIQLPVLSDLPVLGPLLFNHNWMVYFAFILVPIAAAVLFRTTWGLKVQSVGENPQAADTLGVNVARVRYTCVILGGVMAGLAGAFLTVGQTNLFADNISAGRGWIAIALVYFGRWNPWGVLAGSLLFSIVNALQLWIQVLGLAVPYEFAVMMPYVLTIVALAFAATRRVPEPAALTKPYERGAA
jgi:simple sugar transport system permease protein